MRPRLYLGVTAHSLTSGDRLVPMGPEANDVTSRILTRSLLDRIREYLDELRRRGSPTRSDGHPTHRYDECGQEQQ